MGNHIHHTTPQRWSDTPQLPSTTARAPALEVLTSVSRTKTPARLRRPSMAGSSGRTAQGKAFGVSKARWPVKSADFLLGLLKNAEANADTKGLDTSNLVVKHIQVNQGMALTPEVG